jgi:hypothetical protein
MKSSIERGLTNHQTIINYQLYSHNPIFLVLNITINQSSFINDMPMCLMVRNPDFHQPGTLTIPFARPRTAFLQRIQAPGENFSPSDHGKKAGDSRITTSMDGL